MGAGNAAASAMGAKVFAVQKLWLGGEPLRIVAPLATQRTAFQKYGDPRTGTVVDGEFLDIKNCACCTHIVYCCLRST